MSEIIASQDHAHSPTVEKEQIESNFKLGNWFWVKTSKKDRHDIKDGRWLGCVMEVGSNYVEIHQPESKNKGYVCQRIHFSDVHETLEYEPNPSTAIKNFIDKYQSIAASHLNEIKAISARLGVSLQPSLMQASASNGHELMVVSGHISVDDHKKELIKAKEVDLPKLFQKLKDTNDEVVRWLSAESMPLKAVMGEMEESLGVIDDRIFNVSLYAGLTETAIKCCDGEPAEYHEKLHVMQRRLYMDEESLLTWKKGGMEFKDIHEYDDWISTPANRDRILPFQRCIVAMRVRRHTKDRGRSECLSDLIVKMHAAISDKFTYLYIRNGEQIYRLVCDIDFDEMIFPDANTENQPLMVKMFCHKMDRTMTRNEYDFLVKEKEANKRNSEQWKIENPREQWEKENPKGVYEWANPYYDKMSHFRPSDWSPFDSTNVYFDDCQKAMAKQLKNYNHVALIIQGLFDRSSVLHPHPPVKTWEPDSFNASIKLVYDSSNVLNYGDAPDFEAYRARCNALFTTGSMSVGQEDYWERHEAEKECRRRDSSWRYRNEYRPTHWRPEGNNGMGYVAPVHSWNPKTKRAEFRWLRDRLRDNGDFYASSKIETKISVPAEHLFNISAYKKGDYLQFFRDPRTREKYLQWAPLLMAAEEYVTDNEAQNA